MFPVWFPIGPGPLLDAARSLLDCLANNQAQGGIRGYWIADSRFVSGRREILIGFDFEEDAVMARLTC